MPYKKSVKKDLKGPNKFPDAKSKAQLAAVAVTCRYLGKVFYEGDAICYRGVEWVCVAGEWASTGNDCT